MQLKIRQVFGAVQALDTIIREKRPMPQLGKFRLARMHAKLLPEFIAANAQRDELIKKHGEAAEFDTFSVPSDRMVAFGAEWDPIAEAEVEVDIAPLKLADFILADSANGSLEAGELVMLGDLVTE